MGIETVTYSRNGMHPVVKEDELLNHTIALMNLIDIMMRKISQKAQEYILYTSIYM